MQYITLTEKEFNFVKDALLEATMVIELQNHGNTLVPVLDAIALLEKKCRITQKNVLRKDSRCVTTKKTKGKK